MECFRLLCRKSARNLSCTLYSNYQQAAKLSYRHFNHKINNVSVVSKRDLFYEKDKKGEGFEYKHKLTLKDFLSKEYYLLGISELKKEIKVWTEEVKEHFRNDPIWLYRHNEVDVMWKFRNAKDVSRWKVTCDSDLNIGRSTAELKVSPQGYGLFSGNICTDIPKDGKIKRAGMLNMSTERAMKSFKRDSFYDWTFYTHLVMKVRGDGRSYLLNLHIHSDADVFWFDIYHFILFTRGGPYWQTAKIPLSKFFLASKGRIQDTQFPPPLERIANFSITVGEGTIGGPFSLEVDYIGLTQDSTHKEDTAYELYKVPFGVANV